MYDEAAKGKHREKKTEMTEKIEEEMRKAFSKHSKPKIANTLHLKMAKEPNSKLLKSKCPRHNHHNTPRD